VTGPRLLGVEEALAIVLDATPDPADVEALAVEAALGRVVAGTVRSATALPPWDNSAMDGYAVRAGDTAGADEDHPARLEVIGEVAAGSPPAVVVRGGTAVRIATGAPIPPGADAVVPVEQTTPVDAAGQPVGPRGREAAGPLPAGCLVHIEVPLGMSIRARGSDLEAGTPILERGRAIGPAEIALAAGGGIGELPVFRRPRVAVMATGDEVRAAGEPLGPAGIPDANGPGLRALVTAAGADPVSLGIAPDRLDEAVARLRGVLDDVDACIVSGGVSVGPYDVVRGAFDAIGSVGLWRVAIQPGKPFAFGVADRGARPPVVLFGLPGNPVSSFVTFELFARPALRKLAGRTDLARPTDRAVLMDPVTKGSGRRAFIRVIAEREADGGMIRDDRGRVRVRLAGGQGSHVISALAVADALAVIPEDVDGLPAGAETALWWMDRA
jgi:molybdopterin molybdotransferase